MRFMNMIRLKVTTLISLFEKLNLLIFVMVDQTDKRLGAIVQLEITNY